MSEIPDSWAETSIGKLNEFIGATIDPSKFPDEHFELYSVPSFPTGKPEYLYGRDIGSSKQIVCKNDILISKINPRINRVWLVEGVSNKRQIASSEWIVVRSSAHHARYLRHFFSEPSFRNKICSDVTGVGGSLTRAQPKRVAYFSVPIPPQAEQKRIADKLDALLARIDACRDRLDRIPKIIKQFRQSVLAAATSGRLTEDWRTAQANRVARMQPQAESGLVARDAAQCRYEVTPTPDSDALHPGYGNALSPKYELQRAHGSTTKWQDIQTHLGSLLLDLRYGTSKKCSYDIEQYPVLRIPNVAGGRIDLTDLKYADFDSSEVNNLALRAGDILIVRSNGSVELVGKPTLVTLDAEGFLYAGYLIRLRVNANLLNPAFLTLTLSSPEIRNKIEVQARSTSGVNNINAEEIRSLEIHLPSLIEQHEIVRRVESLFALADRLEARVATARARVASLTPATLAKAFRGELVPQDPSDEPASVLLARIRAERDAKPPERRGRRGTAKST